MVVIKLQGRNIPRNDKGDPAFESMTSVLEVFEDKEIVALVNRQLYQMEYSRVVHRQRGQRERDKTAPVRAMVKKMFGVSWLKATEEQVITAVKAIKEESDERVRSSIRPDQG